ncbi:hypothetical protein D3C75_783960 [compost metagenome]
MNSVILTTANVGIYLSLFLPVALNLIKKHSVWLSASHKNILNIWQKMKFPHQSGTVAWLLLLLLIMSIVIILKLKITITNLYMPRLTAALTLRAGIFATTVPGAVRAVKKENTMLLTPTFNTI